MRRRTLVGLWLAATLAGCTSDLPPVEPTPHAAPELLWSRADLGSSEDESPAALVAGGGLLIVPTMFEERGSVAYDLVTGDARWRLAVASASFALLATHDGVILAGQYEAALAVRGNGTFGWIASLHEGYGAVTATVVNDVVIIAADTPSEGDERPPRVSAHDLETGEERWETFLEPTTDLVWGQPGVGDGLMFIQSTVSGAYTDRPTNNPVHALDVATGAVRWSTPLGGSQGFSEIPVLLSAAGIHVGSPSRNAVATLDRATGMRRWERPSSEPVGVVDAGLVVRTGDEYVLLDPATGDARDHAAFGLTGEEVQLQAASVGGALMVVTTRRAVALGATLVPEWEVTFPVSATSSAVDDGYLAVALEGGGVQVYALPPR